MSNTAIDHQVLDLYVSVKGELERLPVNSVDPGLWEIIDQLLLDLHMIRFGYASEGYERYVHRRLQELCTGEDVVKRMQEIRL